MPVPYERQIPPSYARGVTISVLASIPGGVSMADVVMILLTVAAFAALFALIRALERV
jgi:hypothetical protein